MLYNIVPSTHLFSNWATSCRVSDANLVWILSSLSSLSVTSEALTDLFQPRLIVSSKVFQVVFVHLFYNSALFLPSCCCSFLLHVVANLICIVLVSGHLVLHSTSRNFFISFVFEIVYRAVLKNFVSMSISVLNAFYLSQPSHSSWFGPTNV
jgi:hypothetical protein